MNMQTTADLIKGIEFSRQHFLKHVKGMTTEQCDWKPYPNCLSVRETLRHLRVDDLAAMDSMESGKEPKYEELQARVAQDSSELNTADLIKLLEESHAQLKQYLETKYGNQPLDTMITVWGHQMPLSAGIPYFSGEDWYHAGQVAFIRQATDPDWNYYAEIYG